MATVRTVPDDQTALAATRPSRRWMIGLLILAAGARGIALWQWGDRLAWDDRDDYLLLAGSLSRGEGFGYPTPLLGTVPTAYRPPLYPLLLAPASGLSGVCDVSLTWPIGGLHLVLGVGTVWLTVLAGRRLGLGGTSLLAGLAVACDPLLVYNAAQLMTETLAAFLGALLLWLTALMKSGGRRFAAGLAFGLCCLCRPTFWAFGALAVLGWLIRYRPRSRSFALDAESDHFEWPQKGGVVALGVLVAVAPWVSRNSLVMGRPILTTTHGGYTLLLAHNAVYTEQVLHRPWGSVLDRGALSRLQESLEAQVQLAHPQVNTRERSPAVELLRDEWMCRQAWSYMRENPQTAAAAGLSLLGRLWNLVPLSTEERAIPLSVSFAIGLFNAAVFGAALLGLLRLTRDEWPRWWPLPVLLVSFTLVHALYWADMRMRAPLVPAIALLAARAVGGSRAATVRGGCDATAMRWSAIAR